MIKELVINATDEHLRIALLGDGSLLEYHVDEKIDKITVGDIYIGTVKALAAGMNAAFVDVGYGKDAFLHYSDLGPQFKSMLKLLTEVTSNGGPVNVESFKKEKDINKIGKIEDFLEKGQNILVQVKKEAICSKGPRLASEITLTGRYVIIFPFSDVVSVSKKIDNTEERNRLKRLVSSLKPSNFGIIVRTAAANKDASDLGEDIKRLTIAWQEGMTKLTTANPQDKIIGEVNRVSSILRDILSPSFDKIIVDDYQIFQEIKDYINKISPEKQNIIELYKGKIKIFERFGIEKQIKLLFGRTVSLEGGGYLVIEHTEAMHVIDVNSGSRSMKTGNQDESILNINLKAAKEVARQLRLRDMGGIIVVDFIDMKPLENKHVLQENFQEYLKEDRSRTKMLPISKFGLVQITRQRVRPELNINTQEACSVCNGTGKTKSTLTVIDDINKSVELLVLNQNEKAITLFVHPYLSAYLTKGIISIQIKWLFKYKSWIKIEGDSTLAVIEYKFFKKNGDQIEVQ